MQNKEETITILKSEIVKLAAFVLQESDAFSDDYPGSAERIRKAANRAVDVKNNLGAKQVQIMGKRCRRPKVVETEMKAQEGYIDGVKDKYIYFGDNVPRCDRALVMHSLFEDRYSYNSREIRPSLFDELESRGYDMSTFKFSIKKAVDSNE